MSPISRALPERFVEGCQRELQRLRRKTASLPPEARSEVDAITLAVTQAIAARVGAALDREPGGELDMIVARLFAVTALSDIAPE
jgi:hypothetical protein